MFSCFLSGFFMDLLRDNLRTLYRNYLFASCGGALILSVYGLADMAMIGQYHGPVGSAAMAVISPMWNILYCFGLLAGIGGSVLYAVAKGEKRDREANGYFTAAVLLGIVISLLLWILVFLWEDPMLRLFGADDELLPLCREYLFAPKLTVPVYVFANILSAFLRNDSSPGLSTVAVVAGGVINVVGDYLLIFTLDMGIRGAGIATAVGALVTDLIMVLHFFKKKNTLRFVLPENLPKAAARISVHGFSPFLSDAALGVMTVLFNRQIMRYLDVDALAVYGVIVTVGTFVQCCAYGVGQAAQPILSQNYGAGQVDRIRTLRRYTVLTSLLLGVAWTALCAAVPNTLIRLFMAPSASVLRIAPAAVRLYALSFLLLPFNIYSTYHFQSILRTKTSLLVSGARGIVVSGMLVLLLPAVFGGESIWLVMPLTELLVAVYAALQMRMKK